jgi:non-specific serine/threonine protein kinase
LRRYRLAAGLSQEALAERARMSTDGISALERGHRRSPQRETVAFLCRALALSDEQRREFEAATRSGSRRRIGGGASPEGPWLDPGTSNLHLSVTSFVGRETELDEIAQLARDHRLVTLTGAGGIGKTQTALHVATSLNTAESAAFFVALAPVSDPALVLGAIASALGVQEALGHPLLETVTAYLKSKAILLILDNCENVITEAATVAGTLLAGCPNLRMLATSREPLRIAGEYTYRLPSLSVPTAEAAARFSADEALSFGAVVLFNDRARAVNHRFTLTDQNASTVAEICRHLDGIPLAIELAAARVNILPVQEISKRLDHRFAILTGGERTALPRQQTMRAAIDWSYDLLEERERRVFERLSVFAGGCTITTASAVCASDDVVDADVIDLLSSLADKSLLVADFDGLEPRYVLFESFREYAREKLAVRGEQDAVAHRHAVACLELAERLDHAYYYESHEIVGALAHEELDNWRTALHWALAGRVDVLLGQRLIGELSVLWQSFAPLEGRRWLLCALELVDERTPTSVLARLGYAEATIAMALQQDEAQLASSRSAVARYRDVGHSLGIALAQSREAQALLNFGRIAEAKSVLEEALPLARAVHNRWLVGYLLRLLGHACALNEDLASARGYIAEALQNYEAVGAKLDVGWTIETLSWIDFRAGDAELALRDTTDALATFRRFKHVRGITIILNHMAKYLVSLTRYDEAEKTAREALNMAREHHLDVLAAFALQHLGAAAALRSQSAVDPRPTGYEQAAQIFGFVDARLAAMGTARAEEQQEYDRVVNVLREVIGADALGKLMAAGATLTEEQAVEVSFPAVTFLDSRACATEG